MPRDSLYNEPLYYEIAFGFIDSKKQVDLFESFIKKFSKIKVKRVLDIGCGPGLQLREIARRGYEGIGLDSSLIMLSHLKRRSKEDGTDITAMKADMHNFKLKKKVDFAFIMMGTISYVSDNEDLLNHLDSVAASLNKGGLYFIENQRLDWSASDFFKPSSWTISRDGITVKTTYSMSVKNTLDQLIQEDIKLEINDNGEKKVIHQQWVNKQIFPQEFLELVKQNDKFEFIGWFERNRLKRLNDADMDNVAILRRK